MRAGRKAFHLLSSKAHTHLLDSGEPFHLVFFLSGEKRDAVGLPSAEVKGHNDSVCIACTDTW